MKSELTLLSCAHCGSEARFVKIESGENEGGETVECTNPQCQVSGRLIFAEKHDPRPELAECWNRRWGCENLNRLETLVRLMMGVAPEAPFSLDDALHYSAMRDERDAALIQGGKLVSENAKLRREQAALATEIKQDRPDQGGLLSLTSENDFLRKTVEELSVKLGKLETENAGLRQTIRDAMQRIEAVRSQIEGRTHGIDEAADILGGASLLNSDYATGVCILK